MNNTKMKAYLPPPVELLQQGLQLFTQFPIFTPPFTFILCIKVFFASVFMSFFDFSHTIK